MVAAHVFVDGPSHSQHRLRLHWRRRSGSSEAIESFDDPGDGAQRQLVRAAVCMSAGQRLGSREQRHPARCYRQGNAREYRAGSRSAERSKQLVVTLLRELERDASIAGSVLVRAAEMRARTAQQHRAAAEIARSSTAPVRERTRHDERDRHVVVLFFERRIACIGIAEDVCEPPSFSLKDRGDPCRAALAARTASVYQTSDDLL